MDQPALPLPPQIEFGNYKLSNREGIHPGRCEVWCDDEVVVPLTMDAIRSSTSQFRMPELDSYHFLLSAACR
jgi:hypothetical protein